MESSSKRIILNKDTLIPLGFVLVLAAGICVFYDFKYTVTSRFDKVDMTLAQINKAAVTHLNADWITGDMERWTAKLRWDNKDIKLCVPEPRDLITPKNPTENLP